MNVINEFIDNIRSSYDEAKNFASNLIAPPQYGLIQNIGGTNYQVPLHTSSTQLYFAKKGDKKNRKGGGRLHNESSILTVGNTSVNKNEARNGESIIDLICRKLGCGTERARKFRKQARANYYKKRI